MRYLRGTSDVGLLYSRGSVELCGSVDSDYAEDRTDRKSTTGYVIYLGNSLIEWGARKQVSVALSTREAEYMAFSSASMEMVYMRNVLKEIGIEVNDATILRSETNLQ